MSIFRSTNPADFAAIDGIVIAESAPPSAIRGAASGVALMVGQFERGPVNTVVEVSSAGEIYNLFGADTTKSGIVALMNKKFGTLRLVRACAVAAAKAAQTLNDGSAHDVITFTALYPGVYGNSIMVTVAAGSTAGSKYTIHDSSATAVLPDEVYDNVVITAVGTTFAASKLVAVTVVATTHGEPSTQAATACAAGTDGSIADTDYQTAITAQEIDGSCNILFLDASNATRNGYLKTSAANTEDKIVILDGALTDVYTDAITAVATKRDVDGRLVYAFNPVQTTVNGVATYTNAGPWLASLISQIAPNVDPAFAGNSQYLAGVTGLKYQLTRANYIALKNAGICAFEFDQDIGFKVKSGICTQIADTSKLTIARRRMADYLTQSAGAFLKNFQNAVNSLENRNAVKAAILNFVGANERDKLIPSDAEVPGGKAKLVDTDSLNTSLSIGQGYFYVLWKQRIYSSMRFIVVQAQIGETVVVTST